MGNQNEGGLLSPFLQRIRINAIKPYLQGYVLDYGCGNGSVANYISPNFYRGYDVDAASLEVAKSRFPDHFFSNELPTKIKFDCLLLSAVIEHIDDPKGLLLNTQPLLNPKGRIIVTTPHPSYQWIHELGSKLKVFSLEAASEHKTLLDEQSFYEIITGLPFQICIYQRFLFGANQLLILEFKS